MAVALLAAALGGNLSKVQQLWSVGQHIQSLLAGHIQHLQFQLSQLETEAATAVVGLSPVAVHIMATMVQILRMVIVADRVLADQHINGMVEEARALVGMGQTGLFMRAAAQGAAEPTQA